MTEEPYLMYCPHCNKILTPINLVEVMNEEHSGYIFVHDDVPHPEDLKDVIEVVIQ